LNIRAKNEHSAVETRPTADLVPYGRNARTHSDHQIDQIAASIREFGFTNPVLVDGANGIIAGHGRVLAARKLGLDAVPVIELAHLSDEQKRAYILADNQLAMNAGWDLELLGDEFESLKTNGFDMDLIGFSDGEIDRLLKGRETYPPVVVPEAPRHPVSQMGDVWLLGKHRLMCGDSTKPDQVRTLMAGKRAILFATDPPYLVDYDGGNHPTRNKEWSQSYGNTWDDASQGAELYDGFISAAIAEAILPEAAWYCWHASRRQAMLEACWERAGAFVHQQIIWVKDRGVLTRSHYLWKHEPCFYGWIKTKRPPKIAKDTLASVWEIDGLDGEDRPDHPTPKPVEVFAIPIRQHVGRNSICYEPFSGSGTQIVAGQMLDRAVYAMEMEPAYVDVGVMRWEAMTGERAIHETSGTAFADRKAALGIEAPEVA
jgi:DNA modification methylase